MQDRPDPNDPANPPPNVAAPTEPTAPAPSAVPPVQPAAPIAYSAPVEPAPPPSAKPAKRSWFGGRKETVAAAPPPPPPPPPPPAKRHRPRWSERSRGPFIAGFNAGFNLLLLALLGLAVTIHYGIKRFDEPGPLQADTVVTVPRGAGARDVSEALGKAGAISSEWLFVAGVQATGNRGTLQAGEYEIPARASMRQIMDMLSSGKVVEHTITLPEGLTSMQIVTRLMDEPLLSGPVRDVPPEGTLLPETYEVVRGTSREQILQRMAAAQKKLLDEVWAKRNPAVPVKSPLELVTLASIVEKETGIANERPRVASVFVNRLNKRMRLQSDPTIIYGLVGGKGTLGRPILRSEITRPTPYNTYTIPGLPPGPIANPGRASLEAAANPAQTNDIYFVADGSGGHAFASTLNEHNQNVSRWRAIDNARQDTDRAPVEAVPEETEGAADQAPPGAPAAQPQRPRRQQAPAAQRPAAGAPAGPPATGGAAPQQQHRPGPVPPAPPR